MQKQDLGWLHHHDDGSHQPTVGAQPPEVLRGRVHNEWTDDGDHFEIETKDNNSKDDEDEQKFILLGTVIT